jgi:hypothetical protein
MIDEREYSGSFLSFVRDPGIPAILMSVTWASAGSQVVRG